MWYAEDEARKLYDRGEFEAAAELMQYESQSEKLEIGSNQYYIPTPEELMEMYGVETEESENGNPAI